MEKQDLIELKKKLSELTDTDKQLHNEYIIKLAKGEIEGPPTGYASIDKSWFRYVYNYNSKYEYQSMTMYDYLKYKNKNNLNAVALNYFGTKITFREMFENIDTLAEKIVGMGYKAGDVVSICGVATPEMVYIIYALNTIGITINTIDPRFDSSAIISDVKKTDSKALFILDSLSEKLKGSNIDNTKVITMSAFSSLPKLVKYIKNKQLKLKNNFMKYEDVLLEKSGIVETVNPNFVSVIVHTGGTTGTPKGVELTNDNFNLMSVQYEMHNLGTAPGQRFLDIITPTFAYGICNSLHLPLSLGMETILIPRFDPKDFYKYIKKYKVNHTNGVPRYWESLMNTKNVGDLSSLMGIGCGGDAVPEALEIKLNNFLKEHNCNSKVMKGYGMTELSSAVVICTNETNKLGSAGIPLSLSNMMIVEPGTINELENGKIGEILLSSPTTMKGYLNNKSETDNLIVTGYDGDKWVRTGDLGFIDKDGNLFVKGRLKRMIIKRGMKIFPIEIENIINKHPAITNCCVIGIPDDEFVEVPIAYITILDGYDEKQVIEEVTNMCKKELKEYAIPHFIYKIDKIPQTAMGKNDFNKLEEEYIEENKQRVR